jgi:hypothetical protein
MGHAGMFTHFQVPCTRSSITRPKEVTRRDTREISILFSSRIVRETKESDDQDNHNRCTVPLYTLYTCNIPASSPLRWRPGVFIYSRYQTSDYCDPLDDPKTGRALMISLWNSIGKGTRGRYRRSGEQALEEPSSLGLDIYNSSQHADLNSLRSICFPFAH